jgi:PAS domain S-box-containing protein
MSFFLHEDKVHNKSLRSIDQHDHVAVVYESQQMKVDVLVELCRIGLERNERCIFSTVEGKNIEAHLRHNGIDVDSARARGALIIADGDKIFFDESVFDPERTIALFERTIQEALDDGFSGIRTFVSSFWASAFGESSVLLEFESKIGRVVEEKEAVRICLYDLNVQEPDVIIDAILSHPTIVLRGVVCNNFFYIPPDQLLSPKGGSPEMYRLMDNLIDVHYNELNIKESRDELESANNLLRAEIRKRKMVEWALLISEMRYRNTLDSLNEPVHVIDREYRVIIANKALESLGVRLGTDFRCVGRPITEAFPFISPEELEEYRQVFAKGEMIVSQRMYQTPSGKVWAEVSKVPIMDGDRVANVTTIIRQVNEADRTSWK